MTSKPESDTKTVVKPAPYVIEPGPYKQFMKEKIEILRQANPTWTKVELVTEAAKEWAQTLSPESTPIAGSDGLDNSKLT